LLNDWVLLFDLGAWKPVLTALLLPPASVLVPMLGGAWLVRRRPAAMAAWLLAGATLLWLSSTVAVGALLQRGLLSPPPALSAAQRQALRAGGTSGTAIVVLGAGREVLAPEYDAPSLNRETLERLRYGLWLGRETGLPVAYSGGVGHGAPEGPSEAEIAARVAARDFGRPLKWTEDRSRDTRENAARSVALLRAEGLRRLVLVTHGFHMRRSVRAFEQAVARQGGGIEIVPAPMGLAGADWRRAMDWMPSVAGFRLTQLSLREWFGWLAGA
jgi:uncharacterized SAM-binding protein YcdF (DUF218 family)